MSGESLDPSNFRASDADRSRYAEQLGEAFAIGRLDALEYEDRLGRALSARTYGELIGVLEGLPVPPGAVPTGPDANLPANLHPSAMTQPAAGRGEVRNWWAGPVAPTSRSVLAFMGGAERNGQWVVPAQMSAVSIMGGIELDFRSALFTSELTEVTAVAIMGGVTVMVPEGIHVEVDGIGIMGGFSRVGQGPGVPGAPRLRVRGLAFWGGVEVKRQAPKQKSISGPSGQTE